MHPFLAHKLIEKHLIKIISKKRVKGWEEDYWEQASQ